MTQPLPIANVYGNTVDRESAHEVLKARRAQATAASHAGGGLLDGVLATGGGRRQSRTDAMVKSAARAIGPEVGRRIIRGVLGSILGGATRR